MMVWTKSFYLSKTIVFWITKTIWWITKTIYYSLGKLWITKNDYLDNKKRFWITKNDYLDNKNDLKYIYIIYTR